MPWETAGMELADGTKIEHRAEADAGITLSDGARWWGSRFIMVDVHPFDYAAVATAVELHYKRRQGRAA